MMWWLLALAATSSPRERGSSPGDDRVGDPHRVVPARAGVIR